MHNHSFLAHGPTIASFHYANPNYKWKSIIRWRGLQVKLYDDTNETSIHSTYIENDLQQGKYAACMYDSDWYIGAISDIWDQITTKMSTLSSWSVLV